MFLCISSIQFCISIESCTSQITKDSQYALLHRVDNVYFTSHLLMQSNQVAAFERLRMVGSCFKFLEK
jgi:hypothetical protein